MAQTQEVALANGTAPRTSRTGGAFGWVLTLVLLSLLAVTTGGGFGLVIFSTIEKAVERKNRAESERKMPTTPYSGDIAVRSLAPIVTNLANTSNEWIRLEASIIYKNDRNLNPDAMAAEMRQDALAYLRTLTLEQVQGPSGLLQLREDLNERAQIRSKGEIRELIVESLVVQ